MKKFNLSILLWAVTLMCLHAQSFSDEKSYTFDVSQLELLRVHNKDGQVKVKGTTGSRATLRVKRTIKSANSQKLAAAKTEIYLDSVNLDGELMFFIQSPDYQLEINEDGRAYYNSYQNNWNDKRQKFHQVKTTFTIELEVPEQTVLYMSTHREDLTVQNIKADVLAENHHGSLYLEKIGGNVQASTHHGDIQLSLTKVPTRDAIFDTHHGNIKVNFPDNLAANIELKTRHGEFYTDFDYQAQAMPVSLNTSKKGTKYKIGSGTHISIGQGGPKLHFETYHGSIYLLK